VLTAGFMPLHSDRRTLREREGDLVEHIGSLVNPTPLMPVAGKLQVGTKKVRARARTAEGEERLQLCKKALKFWPLFADYQLKAEHQIPVVVLDSVR
jgi:hypothetical protein